MKTLTTFAFTSLTALSLTAATVDHVIVRQQWPWSTDIKVEYHLTDVDSPVDLTVRAFDGTTEYDAAKVRTGITGSLYGISESVGAFTIDPVKAFGTAKKTIEKLKVKIELTASAANINEVIYKIIDIEANPATITDVTRADILNGKYGTYETDYSVFTCFSRTEQYLSLGFSKVTYKSSIPDLLVWTGVTNGDLYRTSKIALRKIPAAGQSFDMGERTADKIACSFTKDFWIGVFPITQYQLHKFLPNYTCWMSNTTYAASALRVADGMTYNAIRSNDGTNWPEGNHSNAGNGSYIKLLQTATGNARFDLPTEAQWEFAARAGCDDVFPHGGTVSYGQYQYCYFGGLYKTGRDVALSTINRNSDDNMHGAYPPGYFAPNAYGLYDVMGNVREFCLDRADATLSGRGGKDPRGSTDDSTRGGNHCRMMRGGTYYIHYTDIGYTYGECEWWVTAPNGFRLCLHEED